MEVIVYRKFAFAGLFTILMIPIIYFGNLAVENNDIDSFINSLLPLVIVTAVAGPNINSWVNNEPFFNKRLLFRYTGMIAGILASLIFRYFLPDYQNILAANKPLVQLIKMSLHFQQVAFIGVGVIVVPSYFNSRKGKI
ncbi:hypothetical protein ACFL1A_00275 [Patescibacteria group bacterium]